MRGLDVPRKYLTASELMERWGLKTDLDLRRLAMEGVLRFCIMRQEELVPLQLVDGRLLPLDAGPEPIRGWLFPHFPILVGPFECLYQAVGDMPAASEGCALWALPQAFTLSDLLEEGVAMLEDVLQAEAALRRDPDRELSAREEKTRDRLITVLAAEHLGWRPWEEGSDMQLAGLLGAARDYAMPMSRNTVKEHLRLAWERAKPDLESIAVS